MFRKPLTAFAVFAVLLTGCSKTPSIPDGYYQQFVTEASDIRPLSLNLQDGRLSAFTGCNNAMGSYTLDKGRLNVSQLASTMMACAEDAMATEYAFTTFLQDNPDISFEGETLTLSKGRTSYLFTLQPERKAAVTRLVYIAPERKPCVGVVPKECLQIREHQDEDWQLFYDEIEGFEPEPGIAYRLRIKEYQLDNPPADASARKWVLDMVVEQEIIPQN